MNLYLMPQFLNDLREMDDQNFVRRVLNQILDDQNSFRKGQNDHRYEGIDNAWIRYISRGRTGYRLIYIQNKEDVYLYRAGIHSVEDNLTKPKSFEVAVAVNTPQTFKEENILNKVLYQDDGVLLKSTQEVLLSKVMTSLTHVGHKEIILVSPFISDSVLDKFAPFGRFLDKMIESGTQIFLITSPPDEGKLPYFQTLAEREINVYFFKNLHAKLYVFQIDPSTLNRYTEDTSDTAILGSANLTEMGLALSGIGGNEELCFKLPLSKFDEAKDYATGLLFKSTDFATYKSKQFRRF